MTTAGFANFLWVALLSFCLIIPQLLNANKIPIKKRWPEALLLIWPLFVLMQTRVFDSDALVMIANSTLFTFLFFPFLKPEIYKKEIQFISKYGLPMLLSSYLLSLALPALIPIEGYNIYDRFGPIFRYKGWTGEGQPIGFLGLF